jgi:hypothetical protein
MPGTSRPPGWQLDAGLERARGRVHLGQDRLHLALEAAAGRGRASGLHLGARAQQRGLALRHLGVGPDGAQAVDAEQRRARHHRHAFARQQFDHHPPMGASA